MTKLNNKGVSLIDCLIAIAVLALLVSPIIAQLFTTIQVSAEAKEKQYVIDDATEVYEYFRKYDNKELKAGINAANETDFVISGIDTGTHTCYLYDKDGNEVSVTKKENGVTNIYKKVDYSWTRYNLENSNELGREQSIYKRSVVRSDLRNQLYKLGLQVDYSNSAGSTLSQELINMDFVSRSDNSIIQPENPSDASQKYDDSKISAIVVKKIPNIDSMVVDSDNNTFLDKLQDPNGIDIGNVQDIDAEKMAIISGDATAIDYQLDLSLQNVLVQYATSHPESAIGTYADDPEGLNNYIKSIIDNSSSTQKIRQIKVSVICGKNASGVNDLDGDGKPKFYTVKCEVTYKVTFSGSDLKAFDNFTSTTGEFTYPVMERNFYTNTPPDIYMIYEPLLISTSMNNPVFYADNDYITIHTDKYTCGYQLDPDDDPTDPKLPKVTASNDDPSRIYLIRSTENWAKVANTERGALIADESNVVDFDPDTYYTYRYGKFYPVHIFVNMDKEGDSDSLPIDIYTNISKNKIIHSESTDDPGQFISINALVYAGIRDTAGIPHPDPPSAIERAGYDVKKIIRVDREKGIESIDRLGQITVTYQKLEDPTNDASVIGDVTYITGAKGAD